ncbi:MAG: AgmX/PglI C-terminal domain-containing protein, partial [Myxococcota bacterium]
MTTPPPVPRVLIGVFVGLTALSMLGGGATAVAWVALSSVGGQAGHSHTLNMPLGNNINVPGLTASGSSGYVPTSAYIEPGAEADITAVNFVGSGEATAETLSDSAFTSVLNAHSDELMACYLKGLKRDPNLRGSVGFRFKIANDDGHVAMIKVTRSQLQTKRVEDCFVAQAKGWTFPAQGSS